MQPVVRVNGRNRILYYTLPSSLTSPATPKENCANDTQRHALENKEPMDIHQVPSPGDGGTDQWTVNRACQNCNRYVAPQPAASLLPQHTDSLRLVERRRNVTSGCSISTRTQLVDLPCPGDMRRPACGLCRRIGVRCAFPLRQKPRFPPAQRSMRGAFSTVTSTASATSPAHQSRMCTSHHNGGEQSKYPGKAFAIWQHHLTKSHWQDQC